MRYVKRVGACVLAASVLGSAARAQEFELSVKNIMRGPDLVGTAPSGLRGGFGGGSFDWSPDSRYVFMRWQQPGVDTTRIIYRVDPRNGRFERFPDADADTILAGDAQWDRAGRRALYAIGGDIWLWERGAKRRLFDTRGSESSPRWSADQRSVYFREGSNIMAIDLEAGTIRQLTDIRTGDAPREESAEGQRAFLVEQQKALFEFIDSDEYRGQPWNRSAQRDTTEPEPFYVGQGKFASPVVTPDGRFALVTVTTPARGAKESQMPVWITNDGYVHLYEGREKVGDEQSTSRVAVVELVTGKATWVADSVGEGKKSIQLDDIASTSAHALVRVETHDREHRYLVVVDLPSLEERTIIHDRDPAWLGFPGPGFNGTAGFMPDGETIYFASERSGWIHLWTVGAEDGEPRALTSGNWEVHAATLSRDGATWYLTTNREGPADVHAYSMPAEGGSLTQLTTQPGRQDVSVSPDGRWLAMTHSESNDPPELYIQENGPGRPMRQITESTTEEFRTFAWRRPELVMVPASDGAMVPARLHRPRGDVAPMGRRPAVIFVHGAGYLQNVHNWWSSYYREYMFHHVLAERGYTVLALDYRGSEGYGRDWRTAIYRHMGGKDLSDQVDAAKWLVDELGVDPDRIGIYGGSYGGFITLMAMFTSPGTFQAGAALRSVTDWAHYNHPYTSGILNEPQDDKEAYVRSSPIYHAEGLQGHLLMAHGMVDDNVLFYDIVRLTQRLIELGKENWELAVYPAERHSFQLASSWTDEYTRILKLFERTLKD